MDIETRLTNIENMLVSVINNMSNNQFYTNADIAGVRHNVSEITPIEITKTAYIDDTEITFDNVPNGNLTIFANNLAYTVEREGSRVTVYFEPLEELTDITIQIS